MSANPMLTFQCYIYCLSTNQGPFKDIEHFGFEQWNEAADTLHDLQLDVELHQRHEKSADAAAD